MRQLRFVAPNDDEHVLLEAVDGGERFLLHVDTPLRETIHSDLPRLHQDPPKEEPAIAPREIQVRVRAGEAPEAIAEEVGAGLSWVLRFAGPVLEERTRMAAEARRGRARRSTADGQTVVFGEAVDERYAAHGIDPGQVRWDARRREDGQWVIAARWIGGESERIAEWSFQVSTRTVAPLDDTAADLLSDRPIPPLIVPTRAEPASATSLSLAPPLRPGVVAFPVMPDAHTGPLPEVEDVYDQESEPEPAEPAPVTAAEPAEPTPGTADEPLPLHIAEAEAPEAESPEDMEAATLPLPALKHLGPAHLATPPGRRRGTHEESEEQKAARAHIPSWDDILLGVRRKHD